MMNHISVKNNGSPSIRHSPFRESPLLRHIQVGVKVLFPFSLRRIWSGVLGEHRRRESVLLQDPTPRYLPPSQFGFLPRLVAGRVPRGPVRDRSRTPSQDDIDLPLPDHLPRTRMTGLGPYFLQHRPDVPRALEPRGTVVSSYKQERNPQRSWFFKELPGEPETVYGVNFVVLHLYEWLYELKNYERTDYVRKRKELMISKKVGHLDSWIIVFERPVLFFSTETIIGH